MSNLMTDGAIIERLQYSVALYERALKQIASANSQATLTALDCERIARKALDMSTERVYPVDY